MKYLSLLFFLFIFLTEIFIHAELPENVASYYAKEFCSCFFVLEREEEFCHKEHASVVPRIGFELNLEEKKVTSGLFHQISYQYTGPQLGCRRIID